MIKKLEITEEEFLERVNGKIRTLSRDYRPRSNINTYKYKCTSKNFLSQNVYPVKFVDRTKSNILDYEDPKAIAITVCEFAKHKTLVDSVLCDSDWYDESRGALTNVDIIVYRCLGCDRLYCSPLRVY